MEINKDYITEDPNQVVVTKSKKKQIILGHTASNLADYFTKITTRFNKKYKHLPAYVISLEGTIYQLYDTNFSSGFMEDDSIDKMAIPIVLENVGWLTQDARDGGWYDWKGHQYTIAPVIQKEWRNKKFWASYSNSQLESLVALIDSLCDEHKIPKAFVGDNITTHKPKTFKGVINRANYSKSFYDISPAMDFDVLNDMINGLTKPKKK